MDSNLDRLKSVFAEGGIRKALAFLNSLTACRFTSLYRFDGEVLHNLVFYDRENPNIETCQDIPVLASYCVFVRDSRALFLTTGAQKDDRLENHPKRTTVQTYCGVPLVNEDGKMFGTICHFDLAPGRVSTANVELLEYMSRLLKHALNKSPFAACS